MKNFGSGTVRLVEPVLHLLLKCDASMRMYEHSVIKMEGENRQDKAN